MNRSPRTSKSPSWAKVTSMITIIMLLFFVLPVTSASAAPLFIPAIDGEGSMVVSPTSFAYGSTGNTLTFTFSPTVGDFGTGSAVDLIIPAGWTTPTTAAGAGHVTVSSGTCTLSGAPPFGIAGSTISIDMASCAVGQSFTVTYSGVTAPAISGSPYEFITQTDIGPGGEGLTTIASSPTVTITKAPLTVSASGLTPNDKVYDGTTAATLVIGTPTLVGVIGTDDVSLVTTGATGTFTNENFGTAKTVNISGLTLGGLNAGNYTLTQPTRTANITARPITITAVADTKTYDGTTSSSGVPTLSVGTPLASGDSATWTQTFDNRNAGTGKTLTPAGTVSDGNSGLNYTYTFTPNSSGVINKKPITITAVTDTKTYDGTTSSSGVPTLSVGTPLASGDSAPAWTQTFDNKNFGTGKTLTPAGTVNDGNSGLNYAYTFTPNTSGVINKKPITITAVADTKTYDGTTSSSGVPTLSVGTPLASGDSAPTWTQTFDNKNFGTGKTLTPAGTVNDGNSGLNYSYTFTPNTSGVINKKPITITAVADTKTYDGTTSSSGTPTLSVGTPLASGDSAPTWTQTFDNKNFGTGKTLTPAGAVNDGNSGLNYSYTFTPNTSGVINKKPITVTAVTDTKTYDGTTSSSGVPTLSVGTPLGSGDSATWTQTFDTENFGTGKTLTPAGTVNDGNSGLNYTYTFTPDTSGVINKKPITITAAADTKAYDGDISSSGVPTLSVGTPLASGDSATWTQTFDNRNAGTGKTLTPTGTVNDGNSGLNYAYTFTPNTSGVINKKPITIIAAADTKAYDGDTSSSGVPTLSAGTPLIAGDIEPAWTQTFDNRNAGTGKTLTPAGTVNDGNSGLNYAYTFTPNTSGVINKKPITITAVTDTKTYDGDTSSSGVPTLSAGTPLIAGDIEPAWTQTFDNKNFGTGKTLTPAGTVNDGNSGLNYAYTFTPDTSGVINKKPITITAVTDAKTYDGTTSSSGVPTLSVGTPLASGDSAPIWTQTFDNKNVGTSKTLTPSGQVNDGNSGLNYAYTFTPNLTGAISAASISVTADPQTKSYGEADPALTYGVTPPLFSGDAFTGALERAAGEDVNTYAISQGTLLADNYLISFTGSDLTINTATLNVKANDKTIIFGSPDPVFDITYTGFQFSENASVLNSAPTCGVAGDHTAIGTYTISCSNGADNNYAFTYSDGVLTVNPVPVAIFVDVPLTYWSVGYIERLYNAGITGGCSAVPLNYCPTKPVTRAQMAIFLVRAMHGVGFTPPSATGVFPDVPVGSFGADFIEQLAADGITSGCGGGNFCPNTIVTRAQMAVFLVRAKHGIGFTPPTATGVFPDVPVGSFGADFIEQLVTDGVTSGCGGGLYCPLSTVKRDSMAVFLVKNFNLP